ncbi:MAG: GTPase ObgE [Pseudomonadota bacterium]
MKFIDEVTIYFKSGKGGPGCVSFASLFKKVRGGPDGGDGGRGGHVIAKVNPRLNSLMHLQGKRQLSAKNGLPGTSQNRTGATGQDLVIEVPPGTLVRNVEGELLFDLVDGEQQLLTGGKGGRGNTQYKTSVNQAPQQSQPGEPSQEMEITLQLKLIADVGVIGFPNAGKSTLVSTLTAAKPKIADYPFTTLNPQLGVVKLDDVSTFTMADIPGLIEGAAEGVGLGHEFLRHIERTRVFVHMLDISDFSERDPVQDYDIINTELSKYDASLADTEDFVPLSDRPQIVVFNKIDSASEERVENYEKIFRDRGIEVIKLSAVANINKEQLLRSLSGIVFGDQDE